MSTKNIEIIQLCKACTWHNCDKTSENKGTCDKYFQPEKECSVAGTHVMDGEYVGWAVIPLNREWEQIAEETNKKLFFVCTESSEGWEL